MIQECQHIPEKLRKVMDECQERFERCAELEKLAKRMKLRTITISNLDGDTLQERFTVIATDPGNNSELRWEVTSRQLGRSTLLGGGPNWAELLCLAGSVARDIPIAVEQLTVEGKM
jgi:hypothetical protein